MVFPQVLHHGAINGVTGSCHQLLMSADCSLLVDCGAFQGRDAQGRSAVLDFAIVIAGSGMCNSGRIVNYLKKMLGNARHCVVFTGYQAADTPGARIQASEGKAGIAHVELEGQDYAVHADIRTLGGYSAHADQQGLVDFVKGIKQWPEEIRLVHGEARAKRALRARLDWEESRNVARQPSADGKCTVQANCTTS